MLHTYLGETISFEIQYKKRGSISIGVDGYGNIFVQAPKGTPLEYILQFLEEKWEWARKSSKEMKERLEGEKEKTYEQGEAFLFLGKEYPIQVSQDAALEQDYAALEDNKLHIWVKELTEDRLKQAVKRFYYQQCKALVEKSLQAHQPHFKMKPRSVRISDSNRTWGTCSSQRDMTFNWKLAMAPQSVIDYVVVHEMCHMLHMNHDRSFWRLVGKIMPDYEQKEKWLALSGWKMTI
ncbi:M48 family metallopeptidase [Ectobacillus ponti]|uniref:M48 family metallopeptidase n=1 Tax=Ectobacillus ponti TaxID=2961894 RepID=A0AA42BR12_9BACI|nr:SprT family zinc-dependent metalloprotease [Ectobacillus ponti]MCP8969941.1 M48 family metallopeptidase [Ectobacillus ponti]